MPSFLGEISCRVDSKGRITMPSKFLKQIALGKEAGKSTEFVINRGIEKCLVIYTMSEWQKVTAPMRSLNDFNVKNRQFLRQFLGGANEISLDNNHRILIPKRLAKFAGLQKEVILLGCFDKIEVWDEAAYDEMLDIDPEEYAVLADEVMGNIPIDQPEVAAVTINVERPIVMQKQMESSKKATVETTQVIDDQAVDPKEEEITIRPIIKDTEEQETEEKDNNLDNETMDKSVDNSSEPPQD